MRRHYWKGELRDWIMSLDHQDYDHIRRRVAINGVPLLKDIPIVGELFKSTSINKRNVTLYVFITPKILRDPTFEDLRLLTRGPMRRVDIDDDVPRPEYERIDIVESARVDSRLEEEERIKQQQDKDPAMKPREKKSKRGRASGPYND